VLLFEVRLSLKLRKKEFSRTVRKALPTTSSALSLRKRAAGKGAIAHSLEPGRKITIVTFYI
jgi:hypothetical protein